MHNKELGTDNTHTVTKKQTKNIWIIHIDVQLNHNDDLSLIMCHSCISQHCVFFCLVEMTYFVCPSVKKEEEDLEDKKSIKKRIKELKVLDPKIAQNLCKYLCPLAYFFFQGLDLSHIHN